jgi:hypothetical protein
MDSKFWSGNQTGGDNVEDVSVDGKIILEWILEKQSENMRIGLILAKDRDQWLVLLSAVMKLWVP